MIRGKGKFGYIDGSILQPSWDVQNSMVMAWRIHLMDESIGETYLFHPTAKDIWDAASLAYFDLEDSSQVFELHNCPRNLRQDDQPVIQYFNTLKKFGQELDLFTICEWKHPDDGALYH